jgi:PASTA domain
VDGDASFGYALLEFVLGPVDPGPGAGHRFPRKGPVPDVRGMSLDDARRTLAREGFKADLVALESRPAAVMGKVVGQAPPPGTSWVRARRIRVEVWHPPASLPAPTGPEGGGQVLRWRRRRSTASRALRRGSMSFPRTLST